MQSAEIRRRFLAFFEKRDHAIIPSAGLVPQDDPSVLFTTAGMQPLVPYLLGEKHPAGRRIADVQKCVRTQDIEEVGDKTHDTFFEMLGNWSLGDYFKDEAIRYSYDFLTSKEEGLGLDVNRLYVTVFGGNEHAPRDDEAAAVWKSLGIPEHRIYYLSAKSNWWSPGDNGPCGPSTEMFYDLTPHGLNLTGKEAFLAADERQEVVEIWNDVFMEYRKKDGEVVGKLSQRNVDTGAGLERLAMVMQKTDNVFATDLFAPLMTLLNEASPAGDEKAKRIVADHIRTAVFMIADGVTPSNTDRGYILRRLIRRAVRYADNLALGEGMLKKLADAVIEKYRTVYTNLEDRARTIHEELQHEEQKFRTTLSKGMKELERFSGATLSGEVVFNLYQTYGFPVEMTYEIAKEKGIIVDMAAVEEEMKKHQELSRVGAEKKFKGGMAGHSETEIKYHTATHLLHQALRTVLGDHVHQKGSNITPDRLRFDFTHGEKMTDEQKKAVEDLINQKIREALPVTWQELPLAEARIKGAIGLFDDQYGDTVKVYQVGDEATGIFSLEFCGGPHVDNTGQIGHIKITKEEAVSAGIRRIKAVIN